MRELQTEQNVKSQDARLATVLKELKGRCKGYLGQFYELIKPINSKYDIAVKVALKKCLRYLVVDSEEAAGICNEFLKRKTSPNTFWFCPTCPSAPSPRASKPKSKKPRVLWFTMWWR